MKRWIIILVGAIIAVGLTGCTQDSATAGEGSGEGSIETPAKMDDTTTEDGAGAGEEDTTSEADAGAGDEETEPESEPTDL